MSNLEKQITSKTLDELDVHLLKDCLFERIEELRSVPDCLWCDGCSDEIQFLENIIHKYLS